MACTGTEEECRRRCIIDPSQCGIGGNAPVSHRAALRSWLIAKINGDFRRIEDHGAAAAVDAWLDELPWKKEEAAAT